MKDFISKLYEIVGIKPDTYNYVLSTLLKRQGEFDRNTEHFFWLALL